jgi:hypothetical protein
MDLDEILIQGRKATEIVSHVGLKHAIVIALAENILWHNYLINKILSNNQ